MRRVMACMLATTIWAIVATPQAMPTAAAGVNLAVGMPIWVSNVHCSLGFFGFDGRKDRLAVTAGHCSQANNDPVVNDSGQKLGEVVARMGDAKNAAGKLTGSRGYTVIYLYDRYSLEPFFTSVGTVREGDYVTKYGQRTGKTNGHITRIQNDTDRPDLALMWSDIVALPGDSGSPWYTNGPMLVGCDSSGDEELEGGGAGSQAQPIADVVNLIRKYAGRWGDNFTVWTQ